MKKSHCCPKCGSKRVLHVVEVADRRGTGLNPFDVAMIARTKKDGKIHGFGAGPLEAFVCTECGYCEHYVKDPSSIPIDGDTVHEMRG